MNMSFKAITVVAGQKISFDMKSGNFRDYQELYRLHTAGRLSGTDVGIPCRQNRLVILDVDVPSKAHAFDGRHWVKQNWDVYTELQDTYKVTTPSGGCHFYFRIPDHIDENIFRPVASIVKGVDVKWNGYVVAPPTLGYKPVRRLCDIKTISKALLERCGYSEDAEAPIGEEFKINVPLDDEGVAKLYDRIKAIMPHQEVTYSEWIEGIFSICAAVVDEQIKEECIIAFTNNKSFKEGDDELALAKARSVDPHGDIGPGTIIKMLNTWDTSPKEDRQIQEKITYNTLLANPEMHIVEKKEGVFAVLPTEGNARVLLSTLYPNGYHNRHDKRHESLYYNKRKRVLVVNDKPVMCQRSEYVYDLLDRIQQTYKLAQFKYPTISHGLEMLIRKRAVDPLVETIKSIKWDGVRRIERFFLDYCRGIGQEDYLRAVGTTFWRSLVYRIVHPGHKCDEIVVLQGPEGLFKTSFVETLSYGHFFACGNKNAFEDRDCLLNMHKAVLVELEEMVSILNSDPDQAKGFITRTADYVRGMFGKESIESPRSFMLFGTCNKKHILRAAHGIRRFLPVKTTDMDALQHEKLKTDRDQLYAEAYADFKSGKRNYNLVRKADRFDEVKDMIISHPWKSHIINVLEDRVAVEETELYALLRVQCIMGSAKIDEKTNSTVYDIMDSLGWKRKGLGWIKV